MRRSLAHISIALFAAALFLAACQSFASLPNRIADLLGNGRGRPVLIHFRGAHQSYAWRKGHGVKRLVTFPTQIQHVVVIIMENRTVDNLFAGLYGQPFMGGQTWDQALNLENPNVTPTLIPNLLSAHFDPSHAHGVGWYHESLGHWNAEPSGCYQNNCPSGTTPYSYVPTTETGIYQQLIKNWAFANNVLQSNEGLSYVSHQYLIAAQSGGLPGAASSPDAESENPHKSPDPEPSANYAETDSDIDMAMTLPACASNNGDQIKTVNMSIPAPTPKPWDNGTPIGPPPCNEYGPGPSYDDTLLDEVNRALGTPPILNWEYIAHATNSIWAAPLGVSHIYSCWMANPNNCPFVVDPDAEEFVGDISGQNPSPRPFAALTYITPCGHESDHPEVAPGDVNDGPQWLAWVVNAIGQSKYWNSTAIIVTWDDWGGFFDHVPNVPNNPGPIRPTPNAYGNSEDPNEWGFRVPVMVISPYIVSRGYISNPSDSFQYRSQGAIEQFVEAIFGLPSLGGDDMQENHSDAFADVFNMSPSPSPLPYVAVTDPPSWTPPSGGVCPSNGNDAGRNRHNWHRKKHGQQRLRITPPPSRITITH